MKAMPAAMEIALDEIRERVVQRNEQKCRSASVRHLFRAAEGGLANGILFATSDPVLSAAGKFLMDSGDRPVAGVRDYPARRVSSLPRR